MSIIEPIIFFLFLLCSCKFNNSANEPSGNNAKNPATNDLNNSRDTGISTLDPLLLDSVLYSGKLMLKENTLGRFSLTNKYDSKNEILNLIANSKTDKSSIEYKIAVKIKSRFVNNFNFANEDNYTYLGSSIKINNSKVDLTNLTFANDSTKKVFPAGIWHWSIEGSALKYYKYNNHEYYLLNGVNLFCNGTHCNSFQVYLLTRQKNQFKANALFYNGILPYTFENIHLIDIDKDGYPEIYVTKNNLNEIKGIKDFEIYTFDSTGNLKAK